MAFIGNYRDDNIDNLIRSVQDVSPKSTLLSDFSRVITRDLNFDKYILCLKTESWVVANSQNLNASDIAKIPLFLEKVTPEFDKILDDKKNRKDSLGYLSDLIAYPKKHMFEFYYIFNVNHIPILLFSKLGGFAPQYRSRHLALIRAAAILSYGFVNTESDEIKYFESKNESNIRSGVLKLKSLMVMQTAFLQYWSFFDDYLLAAHSISIDYNVNRHPEGIEVIIKLDDGIEEDMLEVYLQEYLDYLLAKNIDVRSNVDSRKLLAEIELLNLELRQQKSHFERQIDILETKNELEKIQKEDFKCLLREFSNKPLLINISQNQNTDICISDSGLVFKQFAKEISPYIDDLAIEEKELQAILKTINSQKRIDVDPKLLDRIKSFYETTLEKIKEAKTVIVDTPKVAGAIMVILKSLRTSLSKLGENYKGVGEMIDGVIKVYGG